MVNLYRIVLADNHVIFRRGIKMVIQEVANLKVVGEAGESLELFDLLKKTPTDMVILSMSIPGLGGLEATREINKINPDIKVLVLSMDKDKEDLYHAFSAGAKGYLLKDDTERELLAAIEELRKGGTYVSPLLSPQLTSFSRKGSLHSGGVPTDILTKREKAIIKLIAEGKTSSEISGLLFISERTVAHHRYNIMRKLKVKRSSQLIRYAIQRGYAA
jgi:DNA-binding NarL/FixJ family response regulator